MYLEIFGKPIPVYGLWITMGVVIANVIAVLYLKKLKYNSNDFIILEAYCFLGAFLGAKLLFLLVSFRQIQWNRIMEFEYFNAIMQGGFVFYGGLIGGLFCVFLAGRLHGIKAGVYVNRLIFLIPLIHAFGRIGCYKVGCCYGKAYSGFGAVTYPEGLLAPADMPLFPVQLVEAVALFFIALITLALSLGKTTAFSVPAYLILYGITRFVLETYRGDEIRGEYGFFTTSQWISLFLIVFGGIYILSILGKRNKTKEEGL